MKITHVDTILLQSPFYPINIPHMARIAGDWSVVEVCRVQTDGGLIGYGETIQNYTWGRVPREALSEVVGRDPFELLWEDRLGAGLQMALFDVAGKAIGQPCYRLMGRKVRDACPISYWDMDMPPEERVAEARRSIELGYTSFKLKARPWRDIVAQIDTLCRAIPASYKLDIDFNDHLLNTGNAVPLLRELERFPNVAIFESPIPQGDVPGNRHMRQQIGRPIAHHYGSPPIQTALREDVCDGFVIGGGATAVLRQATVAAEAHKPFWLQMVGTGLTTAFALHFGAVCTHAQWPAITCHELYTDDLLTERIDVRSGYARVPETPGLGVSVDEGALKRLRVAEPRSQRPWDLVCVVWADGRRVYYSDKQQCQRDFWQGNQPLFEPGVRLEMLSDDGSRDFARLKEQVKQGPVASFAG